MSNPLCGAFFQLHERTTLNHQFFDGLFMKIVNSLKIFKNQELIFIIIKIFNNWN